MYVYISLYVMLNCYSYVTVLETFYFCAKNELWLF